MSLTKIVLIVLIEIHGHVIAKRMTLARQNKTTLDLVLCERIMDVHVDLALDQLGTASTAYAAFAGMAKVDPSV